MASYLVANFKKSKKLGVLISASLLHDVVEDCNVSYEEILNEFGMEIASIVFELTSDQKEIQRVGKLEYLKKHMLGMSSYALVLKLCDRLSNILDSPSEGQVQDTKKIIRYLTKNRKLSNTQLQIIKSIKEAIHALELAAHKC